MLKVWFYIALYPVHWTAQSALHFPPLADLFIPTPFSASLGSILAMQQLRNDYSLTFPLLSIARYSFIQLSRLRRREVKENAQTSKRYQRGFEPGLLNCESGILPLSHRAPRVFFYLTQCLLQILSFISKYGLLNILKSFTLVLLVKIIFIYNKNLQSLKHFSTHMQTSYQIILICVYKSSYTKLIIISSDFYSTCIIMD